MNSTKQPSKNDDRLRTVCGPYDEEGSLWHRHSLNIIDLLKTPVAHHSFTERVQALSLCSQLENKVLRANSVLSTNKVPEKGLYLTVEDEKELATEVLLLRHQFTTLVFENRVFRQAALTVIQNIYLFKQRKIFFSSIGLSTEEERQEALLLFSGSPNEKTITLARTFQHLILARVWDRICGKADAAFLRSQTFTELLGVVERLNTLRNIYMLLTTGLVQKLTRSISEIYKQSVAMEDAHQIGSFGIARAAYRYHPSCGVRFSTYAAKWIMKEIQRQALSGRLIRISSDLVEKVARARRTNTPGQECDASRLVAKATAQLVLQPGELMQHSTESIVSGPSEKMEQKELQGVLLRAIDSILSKKSGDVIKRRYGLGDYLGREQSVVEIGRAYGVTRGSIYQLENAAMQKLRKHLASAFA